MNIPTTNEEFDTLMLEIDQILKNNNVPISSRPLYAFREIAARLKVELRIAPIGKAIENNFQGESFSAHIINWFNEKYGDRTKIDFSPAHVVVLIKDDPFRVRIPLVYGRGRFIFDKTMKPTSNISVSQDGLKPDLLYINVYACIDGITANIIESLTIDDEKQIMDFFSESYNAIYRLDERKSLPFRIEAKTDLRTAVDVIMSERTNYGLSKWSSMQFIEKIMKGILTENKISYHKSHDLFYLNTLIINNNLSNLPNSIIDKISCQAAVRYDKDLVSRKDAIDAHHFSINALNDLLNKGHNHIKKNY